MSSYKFCAEVELKLNSGLEVECRVVNKLLIREVVKLFSQADCFVSTLKIGITRVQKLYYTNFSAQN